MKILNINCSVRLTNSLSRELSSLVISKLNEKYKDNQVTTIDLAINTPKHPTEIFTRAIYTPVSEQSQEMKDSLIESNTLVDKMIDAEIYVIGMPLYNFSVPSNFKAFIDNVVRIGRTFTKGANGFEGLLLNKKVIVVNTRGADYSMDYFKNMDHLQPYITTIFGFMGIKDVSFVNVHPVQFFGEEAKQKAIKIAKGEIDSIVEKLK